jgi:protocatechuate 3,4-dioxygenase beta subunit
MHRIPRTLIAAVALLNCSPVFGQALPGAQGGPPIARPGAPTPGLPTARDPRSGPQTGTARVSGRVVATQTGTPLRRAQITLFGLEGQAQTRRTATTDGEGRYEFKDLPAGRFSLAATKAGYVRMEYGQKRPFEPGTPLTVADGEDRTRVDFGLPRGGVIVVRVTDDFAEPLAGAQIAVQRYQYGSDGQRKLTGVPTGALPFAGTDDRGEYRAYGLAPGEYIVSATVRDNTPGPPNTGANDVNEGFAQTFYPGTINPAEAQAISVSAGEEASVQLGLMPSRLWRISGSVVDSEGRPSAGAQLSLVTRTGSVTFSRPVGSAADDGTFSVGTIPPGDHTLEARSRVRADTTASEAASLPISVSGDIANLRVVTGKGTTIGGRVIFEGSSTRSNDFGPPRVQTQQTDQSRQGFPFAVGGDTQARGVLDDAGNFQLAGQAGRVFLTVTAGPMWLLKSVTIEGEDVTDTPLDLGGKPSLTGVVIRMTDKRTQLSGQVSDARGQVLKDYVVVLLPAEQKEPVVAARWIRTVRPDSNGRYVAVGLRPGRYVATAIESIEQGREFSPEFQEQLRRQAREISLKEGESVTLDLKLTPGL